MDLRDFVVAPVTIIVVYVLAYFIRPKVCDFVNYRYFFPALTVKIIGALAVGFIYQFYYNGGDTYNYHTHGSRVIWEAFTGNPIDGLKLFFNSHDPDVYRFYQRIHFYNDPGSFSVIQFASFFDLVTFSSYAGTAIWFAFFSFLGMWFFFLAFYELYPHLLKWLAIAAFFVPSVFFWGSGILKDTITLASLGFSTFLIKRLFLDKQISISSIFYLLVCLAIAFGIKKYILLCFVPAVLFWIYAGNLSKIRSSALRLMLLPFILIVTIVTGFYAVKKIGESDPRYALDRIAQTAQITAYDIRYWTGRDAGSGYSLGDQDGSFGSMLRLAPQAITVTIFRPYIWEVKNVLMLLSSLESFVLLVATTFVILRSPFGFFGSLKNPDVLFCFVFAITFAFAVGVSTYNFGTLVRYKIPMIPFYLFGLFIVASQGRSES